MNLWICLLMVRIQDREDIQFLRMHVQLMYMLQLKFDFRLILI